MELDQYRETLDRLELLGYEEDTENGAFEQLLYAEFGEEITLHSKRGEELYAALCNVIWSNTDIKKYYTTSWRGAGGLVAEIRNGYVLRGFSSDSAGKEDYVDFYCSGGEGRVVDWIGQRLRVKGWDFVEEESEDNIIQF